MQPDAAEVFSRLPVALVQHLGIARADVWMLTRSTVGVPEGAWHSSACSRIGPPPPPIELPLDLLHGPDRAGHFDMSLMAAAGHGRWSEWVARHAGHSLGIVPLWSECADHHRLEGYLSVVLTASQLDHLDAIDLVAAHAAALAATALLHAELAETRDASLRALATALEATDRYTHDHACDVAVWAVAVGRRLGMSPDEIRDLELAAVFHDIGKIAIPSEILNKPGALSKAEFEVMKTHTIIGEQIIQPLGFMDSIAPVVRHEHERWDGAGYPDGIAGSLIPLGSRIIFVCDAYHAITSDRPYRAARTHGEAREILLANSGSQFDPDIVDAFIAMLDDTLDDTSTSLVTPLTNTRSASEAAAIWLDSSHRRAA